MNNQLKNLLIAASFVGFMQTASFAAEKTPIIEVESSAGYTIPNRRISQTCYIHSNRVNLVTRYGGSGADFALTVVETKELILAGIESVLVGLQSEAVVESPNDICDVPSYKITAYYNGEDIMVYNPGGCGSPEKKLSGDFSDVIFSLAEAHCLSKFR